MAIFHAQLQVISRSDGRSAVAAAAYRAGVALWDEHNHTRHDYRAKGGVVSSFIALPDSAPSWMREREMLWNMAEWTEKRKNSRLAREINLALPHELNAAAREGLVREFSAFLNGRYGVAVDASVHLPDKEGDERNNHAHVLFTTRKVTPEGFGDKTRSLDDLKTGGLEVGALRTAWENIVNAALKAAGVVARVDCRSHKDRGIDAPPQIHVGVSATQMQRRGVQPEGSVIHHDFRGRVIDYPALDQGSTRVQHNADIIDLQKYRQQETIVEKLVRITAAAAENAASIAEMQAALNSGLLSDEMRVMLRVRIEQLISLICRKGEETEFLRLRRQEREKVEHIRELLVYQRRLEDIRQELEGEVRKKKERGEQGRALFSSVMNMRESLIGLPPYVIKLEIPISAQFNEAAYQGVLRKQSTAQLLEKVLAPPTVPRRPEMATVALRQDVLQVRELLRRSKPSAQGRDTASVEEKFLRRSLNRKDEAS